MSWGGCDGGLLLSRSQAGFSCVAVVVVVVSFVLSAYADFDAVLWGFWDIME